MSELSLFIDESGDFGEYKPSTPYYIVSMVFHNQDHGISRQMIDLNSDLIDNNIRTSSIHTRPLLRHEGEYRDFTVQEQRYLLSRLYLFSKKCDLRYKIFSFERRTCRTTEELFRRVSREIVEFVQRHHDLFSSYEKTILYYDDGQKQLARVIAGIDTLIPNLDHRHVDPTDYRMYRLAQVADLACCLELTKLHFDVNQPTTSERYVFGTARDFRKSFYKAFARRQLD
ncbi:DUF3800 domain-containing protein [Bifidobacterium simiarum]|uniref:DUF3800 domain-containing protein n=1 Tax=Bifidobacterium simiarum TaxID=2045441 RepID=UPI001BDCFAFB|nr:DUF3800 domain-containing protein [Bifidobacterium simiarum]MBT1167159.1 DUF3800 domain-containing protein [Bifidobacterium simiarum]